MSTDNIPFSNIKKEDHSKLFVICKLILDLRLCFFRGTRGGSELAVVSEPSVFEPLRVYFSSVYLQ